MAQSKRSQRSPSKKSSKKGVQPAPAEGGDPSSTDSDFLVVYVHGIGRHEPVSELKLQWDIALFGRDSGDETRMAYWSDIVHPPAKASRKAKRIRPDDVDEEGDPVAAALRDAGLEMGEVADYAYGIAAELGAVIESGPGGKRKKLLPLPRFLRKPISRVFLKAFVHDTAAYFFDKKKRETIRARFRDIVLESKAKPLIVVAHSQGSIIALEVLSELSGKHDVNVVKLVTIGSPLGLQEVQDFLEVPPGKKPFEIPAVVREWHNFADPLDPVALDKGLRGEFLRAKAPGKSPANIITDDVIVNDGTRRLVGFNPHSAVGYLAHYKVRRSIYAAAQKDLMARFVVARDVAERLAVDQRHSVMIELLEPGYRALGESEVTGREKKEEEEFKEITLAKRVERAATDLRVLVERMAKVRGENSEAAVAAARIDTLRRFVAARLTPEEIQRVAREHKHFNVYAVWHSSSKRKLIGRSHSVLHVDAARETYGARGKGIVWAILDTGARTNHPHFDKHKNILAVWDCTKQGPPKRLDADRDSDGHGSHVAGILAGEGKQYSGIAPEAKLVVYKVLNDKGEGEDAWIIKALDHIAAQNDNSASQFIHGLNLSLGGAYDSTVYGCGFTPICQELRRQWRSGVLVVVASGNEGQLDVKTEDGEVEINNSMSIGDPANLEDCIAVGSVHADKPHLYGVSAFSSRGPTSDGRRKPDVVAPGERITSVNAGAISGPKTYRVESGTSMAAPHVSGLLANFLSARREYRGRPDDVKRILLETCTDIGRDRYHQGHGIPNLMKMLLSV